MTILGLSHLSCHGKKAAVLLRFRVPSHFGACSHWSNIDLLNSAVPLYRVFNSGCILTHSTASSVAQSVSPGFWGLSQRTLCFINDDQNASLTTIFSPESLGCNHCIVRKRSLCQPPHHLFSNTDISRENRQGPHLHKECPSVIVQNSRLKTQYDHIDGRQERTSIGEIICFEGWCLKSPKHPLGWCERRSSREPRLLSASKY